MKILAIDTTGQTAAAALIEEDKLVAESIQNHKLTHSQTILPMVEEVCRRSGITIKDVDYIACAVGPGSFTGLRIGAATAKGLALASGKEIVPVPTLDALAYNVFETEKIICPIMDARRNQVYTAFYQWKGGKITRLTEMDALSIDEVLERAEAFGQKIIFLGDGVAVHREKLEKNPMFLLAPASCSLQRASSVASLALEMARAGESVSGQMLSLIYLRKSQAERERAERLEKEGVRYD